jgi:hypothetical protein
MKRKTGCQERAYTPYLSPLPRERMGRCSLIQKQDAWHAAFYKMISCKGIVFYQSKSQVLYEQLTLTLVKRRHEISELVL